MFKVFDGNFLFWGEYQGIKFVKYGYFIILFGVSFMIQFVFCIGYIFVLVFGFFDVEGFFDDFKKVVKFVQGNVGFVVFVYFQLFLGGVYGVIVYVIFGVINQVIEFVLIDVSVVL